MLEMDGRHAGDRTRCLRMHGDRFRGAREREGTWMVLGILCAFYFCLSLVVYVGPQVRAPPVRARVVTHARTGDPCTRTGDL